MSTCPDTDLYSAYVDGEIPSPWKEKIEAHLSGCEACRRVEARYRQLHTAVKEAEENDPHADDAFLEASFKKLSSRWAVAAAETTADSSTPPASGNAWVRKPVTLPRFAFAAMFLAAVFIPAFFAVKTTETRMESRNLNSRMAAETERLEQILAGLSDSRPTPADTAVYSTDFADTGNLATPVSASAKRTGDETDLDARFTILNSAKMFSQNKKLFSDGEYIIIRLPEVIRFGGSSSDAYSGGGEYIMNVSQQY